MPIAETLTNSLSGSSPAALAIAFAGGVLTSLTPCIYPLIPVTIAFIGGLGKGSKTRSLFYSLLYVLGIATVYTALGAFAALGGTMFGEWASSPWGYLVMGNICLLFALSFFGLFEINFSLAGNRQLGSKSAAIIAFFTGTLAALTASACTAPVLAVLLAYVAKSQNVIYGSLLLFSFSLGMCLLLLIAGTFSGSLMPRAGKWMLTIKTLFGVILLLMAEFYLFTAGRNFVSAGPSSVPATVAAQHTAEPSVKNPAKQYPFPDFSLARHDNSEIYHLYERIGHKRIVLLFFATWCPGCMEELPEIMKITGDFPDTEFLAVNLKESSDKVSSTFQSKGITLPALLDKDGAVAKKFKIQYIPYVLIIGTGGQVLLEGSQPVSKIIEILRSGNE
ncbi:MAG: cytochrome c biogenesis protein CcdA [Candidatus Wallbacteria bacterium]|nr:cytochrome c biogenesis protein CcdA [Candidatus Wallbacteria bacterium]